MGQETRVKAKPNVLRFTGTFRMEQMTAKASGSLTFRTASEFRAELLRLYDETISLGYVKDDDGPVETGMSRDTGGAP